MSAETLPSLPLKDWEPTKTTLHLFAQIIGKVRLACAPARNHWWHAPLYVDVDGLTTRRMHHEGVTFRIDLDLLRDRVVVRAAGGTERVIPLADGLSVARFEAELREAMGALGVRVEIVGVPFGVPMTTPFADDEQHASYSASHAHDFWRALEFSDRVFERFAGWSTGKSSPVHFFWHSFDLALTRFSGRPAPPMPDADPVTREAYSHEVVSFGFWAGDHNIPEPSYYSYTAPEPQGLTRAALRPDEARWLEQGGMALLTYDAVRSASDPQETLLAFLESAYRAGADAAGWDRAALVSSFAPSEAAIEALGGD